MGNRLAQVRAERGWKKAQLLHYLRAAAARRKVTLVSDESLRRRVAVWENQDGAVGDLYRDLLCEVYDATPTELGLAEPPAPPPPAPESAELVDRLTLTRLDGGLVQLLRGHTQSIRMLDRRLGGAAIYAQTTAHVDQLDNLVRYALPGTHREAAADELSQAATLAGWQALDQGRLTDAWKHYETATAAARESGRVAGLSYAQAEQAYVLLDSGRPADARELIHVTRERAGSRVPPILRAWLLAAEGEALAHLGNRDQALRVLDDAAAVLPDDADNTDLPFLMLGPGHLARWRGDCLARIGDVEAIEDLTRALDAMGEGQYGRAEASLRVDLALAFRARGDLTESQLHAQRAADLAGRTGSQRQRKRIADLLAA